MNFKTLLVAALACVSFGSAMAQNNGYGQGRGDYGYGQNHRDDNRYNRGNQNVWRTDLRRLVDRAERDSNAFRSYFERNFRSNGHERRYDNDNNWNGRGGHAEHQGRYGQMSLKDAIQNLDEDMERLRKEIDRNRESRYAQSLISEIREHAADVDARMPRAADWYSYNNDNRGWRYDRSELSQRWARVRSDIGAITGFQFGRGRGW